MLVFPASLAVLLVVQGPTLLGVAVWGVSWSVSGLLVFARQAWLLSDRHRVVARERDLRREAVRRNAELAALTGLATAMTRTTDESDLLERALVILQRAADATSVHIDVSGKVVSTPLAGAVPLGQRAGVLRLPLTAREERVGEITLIQARGGAFAEETAELLGLLADQLALALAHLRDYREKAELAIRDPLTGAYNRRVLLDALDREVRQAGREDGSVALVLLDIDDFKAVNDDHGHPAGDEVLRHVAACGRELVRPADVFARIGGEEFALLLVGSDQLEALHVAERLRQAVGAIAVLPDRRVTVSAGIAGWPADAPDADTLQRVADAALYRAKAAGKDRSELAGPAPIAS
jgi:diguanylate cyclase (GGDEF)-like protein